MTGRSGATRLRTVLFLDVVGSTRIAAELGDDRWRTTLTRFRHLVRGELRTFGGREEDTAGDGFFATFTEPASALRCAASIVRDVQSIGLDVRCGVHIGEVGTVEGRPGGMGVHVGARLMALAGPAEILCTTTVRELVLGSHIEFVARGTRTRTLEGVPGEWQILAVSRAPDPLPPKLEPEEARDRWEAPALTSRRRMPLVLLVGGVVVLVLAGTIIVLGSRDKGPQLVPPEEPPALVRIDPATNAIVQQIGQRPDSANVVLDAVDGLLWQVTNGRLIHWDIADGSSPFEIEYVSRFDPAFGFGSAWTYEPGPTAKTMEVTRYADASGTPRTFTVKGSPMTAVYVNAFRAFVRGEDGIWYVSGSDTRLHLIDPTSNEDESFPTGKWVFSDTGPTQILPAGDSVWLCGSLDEVVKRFDVSTHRIEKSLHVDGGNCPVAVTGETVRHLWILDRLKASLWEIDGDTGKRLGAPYGIGSSFESSSGLSAVGFDSLWFPAGDTLFRFNIDTKRTTQIHMPSDVSAGTVVIDEETHAVWVGNCLQTYCDWLAE